MRKSGNTTRAVDDAVQKLFELGEIVVPFSHQLGENRQQFLRGRNSRYEEKLCVDPYWHLSPNVQKELMRRILIRLKTEHPNQFIKDSITIKLKTK